MRTIRCKPFAVAAVFLAVALPAHAQPTFHHELSIEAMVLNADAVVVGNIVAVAAGKEFHEATIAVEETLRGEHRARRPVRFPDNIWQLGVGGYDAARLIKVQNDASRLLVAMRGEPAKVCGLIFLNNAETHVLRADLSVLRKSGDVLAAVKETVRRAPGVKRIDTFPLTIPIKGGYYFGRGGSTTVEVPVDDALEKTALNYIRSEERWKRTEGANALKHFKSDENIANVKALLKDEEPYISDRAEENGGIEVRIFTVRKAAFDTLKHWGVDTAAPIFKDTITKLDAVRRMSLGGAQFSLAALKGLDRFKNLKDLDLTKARLADADLKELGRFKNLQILCLENTPVTDASLRQLAELKNLRSLQLDECKVTNLGLRELAGLHNLEELWLRKTNITDAGLKELAGLKNLTVLSVSETKVTAAGLQELAGHKSLTTLYLSNDQVTDQTLQTLRKMEMLHVLAQATAKRRPDQPGYENPPRAKSADEVVDVNLWKTPVTDAGLKELAVFVNLVSLNLAETKVTEAGIAQLRKALPKCVIRR